VAAEIMTPSMLERMRESCQMAAECLVMVGDNLRIGMTTLEIDKLVHEWIVARNAYPAPLGYKGFPKSVCTSPNEVVCHGIPGSYVLADGDILNVDVTTLFPAKNGFHGDTSVTFYLGTPSADAIRVVETSRRCLEVGMEQVRHGAFIGDIGAAIEEVAKKADCSVVQDFVGHGVGRRFHCEPQVPHFGKRGKGERLRSGMVFTIEPMINLGDYRVNVLADKWTAVTRDRKLSAQFEHTIVVTRDGCEVLTDRPAVVKQSEDLPFAVLGPLGTRAALAAREATSPS
jgi:methionyl aminopeptidase